MSLLINNKESFQIANNQNQPPPSSMFSTFSIIIFLILLIYVISGILAFIMSLICFSYGGSINDKALGLLLAFVTGPFYWLYFMYNNEYCTRIPPAVVYYSPPQEPA
jgi:uncharacterized membrane protein